MFAITFDGITDLGKKRKENQDSFIINNEHGFAVLCDGVGGRSGGKVASELACKICSKEIIQTSKILEDLINKKINSKSSSWKEVKKCIQDITRSVNDAVYKKANENSELKGMATTFEMIIKYNNYLFLEHVGDSSVYLFRHGKIHKLTEDHDYATELYKCGTIPREDISRNRFKGHLTKAIGLLPNIHSDFLVLELIKGDIILTCSDGLTRYTDDKMLTDFFQKNISNQNWSKKLTEYALNQGGADNVTVITALVDAQVETKNKEIPKSEENKVKAENPVTETMVWANQKIEILKNIYLFNNLTFKQIIQVIERAKIIEYEKDQTVIQIGDDNNDLYVMLSGKAKMYDAKNEQFAVVRNGDLFGEFSWIDGLPRSATIKVTEKSIIMVFTKRKLMLLTKQEPLIGNSIMLSMLEYMAKKLRLNDKEIFKLKNKKV